MKIKMHDFMHSYFQDFVHFYIDINRSELVSNTNQLKMKAFDGKLRDTDVMTTEQILRLIQSIPSKKAEPFKVWLAQVGKERILIIALKQMYCLSQQ